MASLMIHIAVANEVNKELNRNKNQIFIGSIAPDISKLIGETKEKSHFLTDNTDIPNLDKFLGKYKNYLNDDFVMGYYIHLYTDYLWYKYFSSELINHNKITKKDGTIVKLNGNMGSIYMYNDYTNLDVRLIEKYDLDLKMIYNEVSYIDYIIDEIPLDKLNLIINKVKLNAENSKSSKCFVFDMDDVCKFIKTATELILAAINENS